MDILKDLNLAQREAVQAIEGPVLVLAGPGSGKTRVLTHRVAYLVRECGVDPYNVMAVTFTNKAAQEMKGRLEHLLDQRLRRLTIGTFHAICSRILRREAERLDVGSDFVIYDRSDQLGLVRQALWDLNLDDKKFRPQAMLAIISKAKNELIGPESFTPQTYPEEVADRIYPRYQELLLENNAQDFDDLLMNAVQLFTQHPDVLDEYQRRYLHVLVDEFQDTNTAQYALVKRLAGKNGNLFAVGDEDQSIYAFRGADFRNVHRFRNDYPDARLVLLEQSYRSPQTILDVAKAVISHNIHRTPKNLHTEKGRGLPIVVHEAYNEQEEAQYVVDQIALLVAEGTCRPGDCAIMYRTNAQSRVLEDTFVRAGLPYKLVGATRFYARREIKDVLAYLRLVYNPRDSVSLDRIINEPPRGIGAKTRSTLEEWAGDLKTPVYEAFQMLREGSEAGAAPFSARARKVLEGFADLLDELITAREKLNVLELLDLILEKSRYSDHIRDGTQEGEERWNNVLKLRTQAREYSDLPPETSLATFLEEAVGDTRFYARREIKDVLAYLCLMYNPHDTDSLDRIINVPKRDIGPKKRSDLESWAADLEVPVYIALQRLREETEGVAAPFSTRACKHLVGFADLLYELIAAREKLNVLELLDLILDKSGYSAYIRDGTEQGEDRWNNIRELRSVAQEYLELSPGESLSTFLEEVALVSDIDNLDETANAPTLLTLHMAKGLEFPVVFIVGLEDGLLPHSRSSDDPDAMEEERRLCYVGITRAKERVYLLHAFRRTMYGESQVGEPSRFIADIPNHLIAGRGKAQTTLDREERSYRWQAQWPTTSGPSVTGQFETGDRVRHRIFGEGIVIESKVTGADEEVTVAFEGKGIKRLLASFAKLEKLDG